MSQKATVNFTRSGIKLSGHEQPFILGEFHYYRVNPSNWNAILEQFHSLGINFVSTYVNWDHHEIVPGKEYDFTGRTAPERNLVSFLELLQKHKLYCWLRPGPYNYSEWQNGGIPDYAAQCHRGDPQLVKYAAPYLDAVCKEISNYTYDIGGPVIAVQPDNEINPWHFWFWQELGLNGGNGPFQAFLKKKYSKIDNLNAVWNTSYSAFAETKGFAPNFNGIRDNCFVRRQRDFVDFIHSESEALTELWTREIQRRLPTLPVIHNLLSETTVHDWKSLQKHADVVGFDIYPNRFFATQNGESTAAAVFASGKGGHRHLLDAARYQYELPGLPFVAELQSGVVTGTDKGELPCNHYRMLHSSIIGGGVKAWNWFMLVNRDNWYAAPINERGMPEPYLSNEFQRTVEIFQNTQIAKAQRQCAIGIGSTPEQDILTGKRYYCEIADSLYQASLDYRQLDLEFVDSPPKLLFYAGPEWCPESIQRKLLAWVESGMTLVMFGTGIRATSPGITSGNLLELPEITSFSGLCENISALTTVRGTKINLPHPFCEYSSTSGWTTFQAVVNSPEFNLPMPIRQMKCLENYRPALLAERSVGKGKILLAGTAPAPTTVRAICELYCINEVAEIFPKPAQRQVLKTEKDIFLCIQWPHNCETVIRVDFKDNTLIDLDWRAFYEVEELQMTPKGFNFRMPPLSANIFHANKLKEFSC
jgi:hypothetical protein